MANGRGTSFTKVGKQHEMIELCIVLESAKAGAATGEDRKVEL